MARIDEMMIETHKLAGQALDWAVATCLGGLYQARCAVRPSFWIWPDSDPVRYSSKAPPYSIDAGCAQPIFEAHRISILWRSEISEWWACCDGQDPVDEEVLGIFGPTQLIAGLRSLVQARMGDEVEIPEELC